MYNCTFGKFFDSFDLDRCNWSSTCNRELFFVSCLPFRLPFNSFAIFFLIFSICMRIFCFQTVILVVLVNFLFNYNYYNFTCLFIGKLIRYSQILARF